MPSVARHPSLRSGRRCWGRPLASLGVTKKGSGRRKKGARGGLPIHVLPRRASAEGPLASLGATKNGVRGDKKGARGDSRRACTKNIFSTASAITGQVQKKFLTIYCREAADRPYEIVMEISRLRSRGRKTWAISRSSIRDCDGDPSLTLEGTKTSGKQPFASTKNAMGIFRN